MLHKNDVLKINEVVFQVIVEDGYGMDAVIDLLKKVSQVLVPGYKELNISTAIEEIEEDLYLVHFSDLLRDQPFGKDDLPKIADLQQCFQRWDGFDGVLKTDLCVVMEDSNISDDIVVLPMTVDELNGFF